MNEGNNMSIMLSLTKPTPESPPEAGAPGDLVRLPGHVVAALKEAMPVAPTPGAEAEPLTLTIVLKRTDQAGFDHYLHEVYDPASPMFRHFLSQGKLLRGSGQPRRRTRASSLTSSRRVSRWCKARRTG
jgi:hypothetical protein